MRTFLSLTIAALGLFLTFAPQRPALAQDKKDNWVKDFPLEKDELTTTGRNAYFILEPGHVQILENEKRKVTITVLNETKKIGNVETRVVEDKVTEDGKPLVVSRNYFAISKKTKNVYNFGEDIDEYKDGKIANHEGSWLTGKDGAMFGLVMPGTIVVGARYYQEQAPKVGAMDRAENIGVMETVKTPAGTFKNCLKVLETSPLDPKFMAHKYYAPGIGLVLDGEFKLTRHGFLKKN